MSFTSDTYINPVETGLYYLGSRYYSPELCRFISADITDVLGVSSNFYDKNLYAYCDNNSIVRVDLLGKAWETIFDVLSLGASILEVAFNPEDPFAWMGLAGDTIDLIPFVTGVGETIRALKVSEKIAEGTDDAIDTYNALRKVNKGTGKEVHHIVEKRFNKVLDINNTNFMLSTALDKDVHRRYTNAWRAALSYGKKYEIKDVLKASIKVYKESPTLLGATMYTIFKYGK